MKRPIKRRIFPKCLFATNAIMDIMISAWEKQKCLHADVIVSKMKINETYH
jgi:hypothetical protein